MLRFVSASGIQRKVEYGSVLMGTKCLITGSQVVSACPAMYGGQAWYMHFLALRRKVKQIPYENTSLKYEEEHAQVIWARQENH